MQTCNLNIKKKEKERSEHEWKLHKLTTNSNQLLIEIRENKKEVVILKSRIEKVKNNRNNNKVVTREHFTKKDEIPYFI